MRSERPTSIGADLALLAVAAIWGLTFTAVQRALDAAAPFSFLTARFTLAAVVLALFFPRRVFRINWRVVTVAALLGVWLTAGYALQTVGLLYTTASKSAFITGLSVILVPLLALAVSRTLPRPSSLFAVLLAAGGLYLAAIKKHLPAWTLKFSLGSVELVEAQLGYEAGVVGASVLVFEGINVHKGHP